jgi:hypothetical protein
MVKAVGCGSVTAAMAPLTRWVKAARVATAASSSAMAVTVATVPPTRSPA